MKKGGFIFASGVAVYTIIFFNPMSEGLSKLTDQNSIASLYKDGGDDLLIINTIKSHGWDVAKIKKEKGVIPVFISKIITKPLKPKALMQPKGFFISYIIQPGDTIWKIAKRYDVAERDIHSFNDIKNGVLKCGCVLKIPLQKADEGKKSLGNTSADRLEVIAEEPSDDVSDETEEEVFEEEASNGEEPLLFGFQNKREVDFIRPVPGRITSPYQYRGHQLHEGIDLAASVGQPVEASASGKVIYSGWIGGYGWIIIIEHANGYTTRYAHNSALLVKSGEMVSQGQVIAKAGSSGKSNGSHVHFEIRKNGIPQNPVHYLE